MKRKALLAMGFLAAVALTRAGPPFVTDDPEPTRTGGWENYLAITGTSTQGTTAGQAALDLNYGAAPNVQITLSLPAGYTAGHGLRAGVADTTAAIKYRFLQASDSGWLPDAAIFPAIELPTGTRAFGTGHLGLFLPVWLQKDFGAWSSFGGGGYGINPGGGQRNYTLAGWAITRSFGESLNVGVEIYHQTPTTAGGAAQTNLAFGAIVKIAPQWALLASGGPGLQHPARAGASAFYVSLQFAN